MKKRDVLLFVLLLTIGFATVSTTLFLNGNVNLGFNDTKFDGDVIFTKAKPKTSGSARISESKKEIIFNTEKLENINQTSILEFDVTNKNRNYDANVTIKCGLSNEFESYSKYLTITTDLKSPFDLSAGETKTGHLTIKEVQAFDLALEQVIKFSCELVATPTPRDTLGDEYVPTVYKDKTLNGADPVLKDELIPVTLSDDGKVTYAYTSEEWYNYTNQNWANAVILTDRQSKKYQEGNVINEEDIESYFVWIPRYRYQIFDVGSYKTQSGNSKSTTSAAKSINIVFEGKDTTPSTGTSKNSWLTHPAFTTLDTTDKKVSGIWVGKFETSKKDTRIQVKPSVISWRNETAKNFFNALKAYDTNLDSHMMKNTEWGAVAYLSHSIYGINTEIRINNNSAFLTGYSAVDGTNQSTSPGTYGTDETVTLPYNTPTGYKSSSTGNITGVYDMSGGSWEYVAGCTPGANSNLGFTNSELTANARYVDIYPSNSSITSWNNRILGDATGEMGPFYYYADGDGIKRYHSNWYDDEAAFVYSTNPWFHRGGYYRFGSLSGQFNAVRFTGEAANDTGSRIVLAPIN